MLCLFAVVYVLFVLWFLLAYRFDFWLGLVMLLVFSLIRWVGFTCGGWF